MIAKIVDAAERLIDVLLPLTLIAMLASFWLVVLVVIVGIIVTFLSGG